MTARSAASGEAAALASLVAAEQAAVFGLSAAGGRLDNLAPNSTAASVVSAAYDVHRLRRDAWSTALRARREAVPTAAAAYTLPDLSTVMSATVAAAAVERRCAVTYDAALTGLTNRGLRAAVTGALTDAARRQRILLISVGVSTAQATSAFPGR